MAPVSRSRELSGLVGLARLGRSGGASVEPRANRSQSADEAGVRDGLGLVPSEPANLSALARAWRRRPLGVHQIAKVEVSVGARVVDVHMNERRPAVRVKAAKTRLFEHFAERAVRWPLAGVDVTTRLEPQPQPLVQVEQDPRGRDDHRRSREVPLGVVERRRPRLERGEHGRPRGFFTRVARAERLHGGEEERDPVGDDCARVHVEAVYPPPWPSSNDTAVEGRRGQRRFGLAGLATAAALTPRRMGSTTA